MKTFKHVFLLTLMVVAISSGLIFSQTVEKPYTFSAGDEARASEINANFDRIFDILNSMFGYLSVNSFGVGIDGNEPNEKVEISLRESPDDQVLINYGDIGFFKVLRNGLGNSIRLEGGHNLHFALGKVNGAGTVYFDRYDENELKQTNAAINTSGGHTYFSMGGGNFGIGTKEPLSKFAVADLPRNPPDSSGNYGMVCVTNDGNFWVDADGVYNCQ